MTEKKEAKRDELTRLQALGREVYHKTNATTGAEFVQAWTKLVVEVEQAARIRERSAFAAGLRYVRDLLFTEVGAANSELNRRYPEIPSDLAPKMPEGKRPPR